MVQGTRGNEGTERSGVHDEEQCVLTGITVHTGFGAVRHVELVCASRRSMQQHTVYLCGTATHRVECEQTFILWENWAQQTAVQQVGPTTCDSVSCRTGMTTN